MDCIPGIGNVSIPEGWFKSARARKPRRNTVIISRDDRSRSSSTSEPRSGRRDYHMNQSAPAQYASVDTYCQQGINDYSTSPSSPALSNGSGPTYSSSSSPVMARRHSGELLAPISDLEESSRYRKRDPGDEEILRRLTNSLLH